MSVPAVSVVLAAASVIAASVFHSFLGNSTRQLWEKVGACIEEARVRSADPRLYEHFEYLHEKMNARAGSALGT